MLSGSGNPDATIVIPQYEQSELTIRVVEQLRRWESKRWPVVVVDDGSRLESTALVERACRDVRVVRQVHRGVTAAWNAGLRVAATPLVILLNNDVTVSGACVDALLAPLRRGAVVSGVELRMEGAVPRRVLESVGRREFLAGWCWAFRRDDVLAIGGFDESLKLYFSDTDLQARLLSSAGGASEPNVVTGLPLRHLGHRSTQMLPERRAIWRADRRRFIEKWTGGDR